MVHLIEYTVSERQSTIPILEPLPETMERESIVKLKSNHKITPNYAQKPLITPAQMLWISLHATNQDERETPTFQAFTLGEKGRALG